MLFSTAEPTPALSTATALIAAAVVGVIDIDIPTPPRTRPGRIDQKSEDASRREYQSSDIDTSVSPIPTSQRAPTLSVIRPACGATMITSTVIGRNVAPACT